MTAMPTTPVRGGDAEKTKPRVSEALKDGAGTRSRTRDLLITSQLLYQLSYTGVMGDEYTRMF